MKTFDVEASATTTAAMMIVGDVTVSTVSKAPRGAVPPAIPASQMYFWTELWQQGERETREDFERGDTVSFKNPLDAIRWLLSDEE